MIALVASLAAGILLAANGKPESISGTLLSIGADVTGATITIVAKDGKPEPLAVAPAVQVRERIAGAEWKASTLSALAPGEPIEVFLDAGRRAVQVDAEYELVTTRVVIVQDGYLIGADGAARKLVGAASAATSVPLGAYVELRVDPASGNAFDATISARPFARAGGNAVVSVTFEVQVPLNTPPSSTIFLATNTQSWTPNAVRLSPQPGNRWTVTVALASGTVLQYKYTRGSWSTGERDTAGSEIPSRSLTVSAAANAQQVRDIVARWADLPS